MPHSYPPVFHLDADIRSVSRRLAPKHQHPFYPREVDRVRDYLWNRMMKSTWWDYLYYRDGYQFFTSLWYTDKTTL